MAVQWFEVKGAPRLNDHGTPGWLGKFDREKSPELGDYLEGEEFKPLRVVEGVLPPKIAANDYLTFTFTEDDAIFLEPRCDCAFLLLFVESGEDRAMSLAKNHHSFK